MLRTAQTTIEHPLAGATITLIKQKDIKSANTSRVVTESDRIPSIPCSLTDNTVHVLTVADYKPAAATLAQAFASDHVARYFIDTPDRAHWSAADKWELHVNILEYITYAHLLKGLVLACGPQYGCVALWMPPGNNMDDYWTIARSGMWRLAYKLSGEGKRRFFGEFLPLLHHTKEEVLGNRDNDSWYLVYIGTRPGAQGKGYARKCVEHVTKGMADREGRCAYLESSNDINPVIYGRLGFEIVRKIKLERAEKVIDLDIMVREPVKQQ